MARPRPVPTDLDALTQLFNQQWSVPTGPLWTCLLASDAGRMCGTSRSIKAHAERVLAGPASTTLQLRFLLACPRCDAITLAPGTYNIGMSQSLLVAARAGGGRTDTVIAHLPQSNHRVTLLPWEGMTIRHIDVPRPTREQLVPAATDIYVLPPAEDIAFAAAMCALQDEIWSDDDDNGQRHRQDSERTLGNTCPVLMMDEAALVRDGTRTFMVCLPHSDGAVELTHGDYLVTTLPRELDPSADRVGCFYQNHGDGESGIALISQNHYKTLKLTPSSVQDMREIIQHWESQELLCDCG
jgi:hypothetical protein